MAAAIPSYAWAQCSPDPAPAGAAVTCTGIDGNGYAITASTALTVTSGASVTNTGAAAISVSIPATSTYSQRSAVITVNGTVSATGAAGISVGSGALGTASYDYYGTSATVIVGAAGAVSGTYGITAAMTAGNSLGPANVVLDNAGTITGTSGVALYSAGTSAYFSSVINRATGTIGAIQANANITNAGAIDGGALSAIASGVAPIYNYSSLSNSGRITSTSVAGTIATYGSYITNSGVIANTGSGAAVNTSYFNVTNLAGGKISASGATVLGGAIIGSVLTNSGTVANTGTGAAIALGNTGLSVTNNEGGVISTAAGNTVISTGASLYLVNKGTIIGNIIAGGIAGSGASTIDSTRGTITGNLTLGSGSDTLIATLKNGSLYTGVSGTINGGGGVNMVLLSTATDATLASTVTLPTNFTTLDLAPAANTTLTLASTYRPASTVLFDGPGTLDNQATINGSDQIFAQLNGYSSGGTFRNSGTITSTVWGINMAAVQMISGSIANAGSISATGKAVILTAGNTFSNSGTIIATATAASVYAGSSFSNSGAITSTGGTALSLMCGCSAATNSGAISGYFDGVDLLNGTLVNTGKISSGSGTGAMLYSGTALENRAGGVISGPVSAISVYPYSSGFTRVYNAGTLNGQVYLVSSGFGTYVGNTFVALPGGVLNGNLRLGANDTLVTALSGSGTSGYAGINGTVYAANSALRYNLTGDVDTTLTNHAGFSTLGYQIASGTTLTLNTNGTFGSGVTLAGQGNVVFNGAISTTNAAALVSASVIASQSGSTTSIPATVLTVTNNGSLASTRTGTSGTSGTVLLSPGYSSVSGLLGSTFINNGTVSFTDTTFPSTPYAAVSSTTVVNNGSIAANGGVAVSATTLTNAGTITATGNAVLSGTTTITNSGTIMSTGAAAIGDSGSYYSANYTLNNLAGGTVTGVGNAVLTPGGTVNNAGTINGNVNLASSSYGASYASGIYIASGGTLNGNLTFGAGSDYLVETGSGYGVTGTINGGGGTNWIGHQRSGTATVTLGGALPTGFSNEATVAAGSASKVTITGPAAYTGNVYVSGDGAIVNQVATTGTVYGLSSYGYTYAPYTGAELAAFVNRANVGGVLLQTGVFDNSATIGSASLTGSAVSVGTSKNLAFNNSGTILNSGPYLAAGLSATTGTSTVTNSGTIVGGISASVNNYGSGGTTALAALDIVNNGTISGAPVSNAYPSYGVYADAYNVSRLTLTNSGKIGDGVTAYVSNSGTSSATALAAITIVNSGTINGTASGTFYNSAISAGGYNVGMSVTNSGTINGSVYLYGGDAALINTGTINGSIFTSGGRATIAMNGAFTGNLYAGTGINTLSINGGTQAAPVAFGVVSGVTTLAQTGGFATVAGFGTFGSATLTGGRLVGLAGSVMNAGSFIVGSGATFGSAGTVNGNVTVSGTLSPGASPGTMTVRGNVTLNGGSTSLFEITPAVSDKLNVTGKVTIASGSTLQIAASAPVKVGTTLDLITASGGIAGTYDTVTGIAGTVRALANGDLGLLVQFANPAGYTPQVRNAIAYVNSAMAATGAPAALFPALSALQDGNAAPIASAFAQLTPEPYADAMQIGTETALSLTATARSLGEGETRGPTHVFSFGQMLGSLRQFASNEEQGVSHATINGFGVLGGLGVAGDDYAVSAYVGWVDQHQSIATLGASTTSRGVVGGVAARFGGATRVTLSAGYDNAHALTRRYVPDAGTISTSYALPGWSFDAAISHAFPLGGGWVARPQIGTTWVMTSHDAINEASAHPFALNVGRADATQGFVDAGLGFETAPDATGPWRRFMTLGARYRVEGDQPAATASLAGYTPTLTALGVGRNRWDATLAAGVEYRVAPGASLFLNASGELGKEGKRESVTGGVRFRL